MKAPFNFVPVSKFVYEPDWAPFVTQDIPFEDGVSGEIKFKLIAKTPLLVGGDREKVSKTSNRVFPFKYNDTYAIPPSSLKGMLRNVLEIATFSRFHRVEEKRFGIRDLAPQSKALYQSKLLNTANNNNENVWTRAEPKIKAGWLKRNKDGTASLLKCELARVHFSQLHNKKDSNTAYRQRTHYLKNETNATERYNWWDDNGNLCFLRDESFFIAPERYYNHSRVLNNNSQLGNEYRVRIKYKRAYSTLENLKQDNGENTNGELKEGKVIFTGKQNDRYGDGAKKYEFFFYDKSDNEIHIDKNEFNEFIDINEPSDGRDIHPTWKLFKKRFNEGEEIPVFWIELAGQSIRDESQTVRARIALGMAYMFKIPHEQSTKELIENTSEKHFHDNRLDFATALFGDKADQEGGWGLKGRVHFNFAEAVGRAEEVSEAISATLMGPKPSYYPYYVNQKKRTNNQEKIKGNNYASYTSLEEGEAHLIKPHLAGQKRYLVKTNIDELNNGRLAPLADATETAQLKPLAEGAEFEGSIRFHNLRPVELGALFWALTWGDSDQHFHSLGMGKPYGLGRVKIKIENTSIESNLVNSSEVTAQNNSTEMKVSTKAYMDCFVSWMDEVKENSQPSGKQELGSQDYQNYAESDWYKTPQLTELMAMAKPVDGQEQYKYMQMSMNRGANEFANAKTAKLRLRPHSENS